MPREAPVMTATFLSLLMLVSFILAGRGHSRACGVEMDFPFGCRSRRRWLSVIHWRYERPPMLTRNRWGVRVAIAVTVLHGQPIRGLGVLLTKVDAWRSGAARQRDRRRKSTTSFVVACGCSSVIQCPQSGMITSSTLAATHRITAPIIGPNVASPPKAKTGI